MTNTGLSMYRGDTPKWPFAVTSSGEVFNIAGCLFWFTAKYRISDDDPGVFQKTLGNGISVTDVANGLGEIELDTADTLGLTAAKTYLKWDLQMKTPASKIYTLAAGDLIVTYDITQAT